MEVASPVSAPQGLPDNFNTARRLPLVLQADAAECGLACLAMVVSYYGFHTDIGQLRRRFAISSHGAKLKTLMSIAGRLQLAARALRVELNTVPQLQLPCVVHWDMNHFVVLKSVNTRTLVIHDPAVGMRRLNWEEFSQHFTGIALELTPTAAFEPGKDSRRLSLSSLWSRQVGLSRTLVLMLFLSLLLQLFTVVTPFYMQTVVDDVILRSDTHLLLVLALGFGLLLLIETGVSALRQFVIIGFASRLNLQMAANLFHHMIRLPLVFFQKRHIGDVVSRFGSLDNIRQLLSTGLVSAIVDGLMAVVTLLAMFVYDVWLTLVVLVTVALYLALRLVLYRPLRLLSEESLVANAHKDTSFLESVRAIQTVKLFQKENERQNQWQNRLVDSINKDIRIARLNIGYDTANRLLFGAGNILVIFFAAQAVMGSVISLGMFYAFMSFKQRFVGAMDGLIDNIIEIKLLGLHLQRLADIAFTPQEAYHQHQAGLPEISRPAGRIEVDRLSFRYADDEPPAFGPVSFTVEAGEIVAIVGSSGAGKTTLIKCLMGLLSPSEGSILIDGQPVSRVPNYRNLVAGVMQDDQLLSGSIADNISCFDPQGELARVVECARMACIHDEITAMPMQYNTLVGDLGTGLSGGQKQRIAIARALYSEPVILFMDEASSHLDIAIEQQLNFNLRKLSITRVIAAHRPETIRLADRTIRLGKLEL
ncbi:peptidase domain-containing ABC transporter [Kineobactrum salinum]|uniref:Peptidase domain-containing ABC transporter n=1 Tax=Kineobactrum salinum TaxID=2708301 RepID=A0A6C0U3Y1_9GAMM|nr:peptidase domain-containing ABC transporter [Kineobactrum salinum]QIB65707.1 peptidase domain-containing ABC transporter [Kineobactrum salinum]